MVNDILILKSAERLFPVTQFLNFALKVSDGRIFDIKLFLTEGELFLKELYALIPNVRRASVVSPL